MPDEQKDPLRKDEIEEAIKEYERQKAGLPDLADLKAPVYLSMALEDIRKKSPTELSEAIFELCQYALSLQRLINKNKSWERWGRSKLDELATGYLDEVPTKYGSYERTMIAKNKPELCKALNQFIRKINMECERLNGIPEYVMKLADSIKDMKYTAIMREKSYEKGN